MSNYITLRRTQKSKFGTTGEISYWHEGEKGADPETEFERFFGHREHLCYTLEPEYDEKKSKVMGSGKAIAPGLYPIRVEKSVAFSVPIIRLYEVPGRCGILIHPGNTTKDSRGCILPGTLSRGYQVVNSRRALKELISFIKQHNINSIQIV